MKKINAADYKNALVIYPHPDDEVLGSGGLAMALNKNGANTTLIILTKGERGTSDASVQKKLKKIRSTEAKNSAKILKYKTLIHEDFGDGQLINKTQQLRAYIKDKIKTLKPDLVITYDPSGLYGHPDHMITSDIVTRTTKEARNQPILMYTVLPQFMYQLAKLPIHMANDKDFAKKRKLPNARFFTGFDTFEKMKALRCHKTQLEGFKRSVPLAFPLQTYALLFLFEYYHEVKKGI